ncbi:unnamed protein product [Microthlaspi erraticum]|uniref:Replication protein A 70 kDa DNA-binding subunit B/D first OB fold domain-containing protein n=1 Tax=Microthlaspi erraticum TaxID=1685480 RepID=A0A6D2L1Q5_9BRAS|nr:unnamed protein product [Microthlaspi erraticum]
MAVFNLLSELHTKKSDFRICAKVVRRWTNETEWFGHFLEIILRDEMGTMIQASVPNGLAERLNVEIKEGDSYVIEKFNVSPVEKNPPLFDQKYHIFFSTHTVMRSV